MTTGSGPADISAIALKLRVPDFQSSKLGSETLLLRRPLLSTWCSRTMRSGFGIGKRAQQDAVDDAEDGRGGADAEPERQDGDDGEPLGANEEADAVADIAA